MFSSDFRSVKSCRPIKRTPLYKIDMFGRRFDLFDSLLEFVLEGFLEELSSFVEEEEFHNRPMRRISDVIGFGHLRVSLALS